MTAIMHTRILYVIPAGAERTRCFKCTQNIYLVMTTKGHRKAVDCREEGTTTPSPKTAGEGYEHRCATTPTQLHQRNGQR